MKTNYKELFSEWRQKEYPDTGGSKYEIEAVLSFIKFLDSLNQEHKEECEHEWTNFPSVCKKCEELLVNISPKEPKRIELLKFRDVFVSDSQQRYIDEHTRKINEIIDSLVDPNIKP